MAVRCTLPATRGAVAQLGERRVRNAKVGSSILLGSTTIPSQTCRKARRTGHNVTQFLVITVTGAVYCASQANFAIYHTVNLDVVVMKLRRFSEEREKG